MKLPFTEKMPSGLNTFDNAFSPFCIIWLMLSCSFMVHHCTQRLMKATLHLTWMFTLYLTVSGMTMTSLYAFDWWRWICPSGTGFKGFTRHQGLCGWKAATGNPRNVCTILGNKSQHCRETRKRPLNHPSSFISLWLLDTGEGEVIIQNKKSVYLSNSCGCWLALRYGTQVNSKRAPQDSQLEQTTGAMLKLQFCKNYIHLFLFRVASQDVACPFVRNLWWQMPNRKWAPYWCWKSKM